MRVAIGLPFIVLHLAVALLLVGGVFPWLGRTGRQRLVHWWSLRLLSICGIRLRIIRPTPSTGPGLRAIADAMRPDGIGAMLVSNHISWIDIYVVHAVRPARFVAKSEIAQWPVVGYLTRRTGTVFIERGKRHAVREANYRVAQLLREGELIVMFPEGVAGDGDRVLPFHANLIQPAIDACAPIVVAGLRYLDATGRLTTDPSYAGDVSLVQSVMRTMRTGPITAELHLIDAIDSAGAQRHDVVHRAREAIAAALGFDDDAEEALEGISSVIVVADDGTAAHEDRRREDLRRDDFRHDRYRPVSRDAALADSGPETVLDPRDELL